MLLGDLSNRRLSRFQIGESPRRTCSQGPDTSSKYDKYRLPSHRPRAEILLSRTSWPFSCPPLSQLQLPMVFALPVYLRPPVVSPAPISINYFLRIGGISYRRVEIIPHGTEKTLHLGQEKRSTTTPDDILKVSMCPLELLLRLKIFLHPFIRHQRLAPLATLRTRYYYSSVEVIGIPKLLLDKVTPWTTRLNRTSHAGLLATHVQRDSI